MENNKEKLQQAIGTLLDMVNEGLDKKETPNEALLEVLGKLVFLTSLNYQLD